jgi:prepilin-type N-terminal cleavage/methylation domain-containing protein
MKKSKRSKGFTLIEVLFVTIVLAISWVINIYKFTECDFKENYRCEILHGIGLVPMFAPVVLWFGTDKTS